MHRRVADIVTLPVGVSRSEDPQHCAWAIHPVRIAMLLHPSKVHRAEASAFMGLAAAGLLARTGRNAAPDRRRARIASGTNAIIVSDAPPTGQNRPGATIGMVACIVHLILPIGRVDQVG